MKTWEAVLLVVVGGALILGSRTLADQFKVPGGTSTMIRLAGMGDDYPSRVYRYVAAMGCGLVLFVVGVVHLVS